MALNDIERKRIEKVVDAFVQERRPAPHIRPELDIGFRVAGQSVEIFEIRPVEVMEVVTFYNMFFDSPQAKHHVYVCTNLPCSLRGARSLLHQLESHLGVTAPGETPDGRIFLGHEECLGACGYAPMMRVDGKYHEDLDVEKAKRILDSLGD